MQTKLRIGGLMFAASLLGASPISAATQGVKIEKAHGTTHSRPAPQLGLASWYGQQHQGRKMANGQKFDRKKFTAASWALPLGTSIRVVNLRNGASVVVTVTDRGPAHRLHRVLDLSEAAAEQLGYREQGLTPVFYSQMTSFELQSSEMGSLLVEPGEDKIVASNGVPDRPL